MPRPVRSRKICGEPKFREFAPVSGCQGSKENVILTVDEYEVMRLVDLEKKTHSEAVVNMDISRTTVTEIYEAAREKITDCIVNGKRLIIQGGSYWICNGSTQYFCTKNCEKRRNYIRALKEAKAIKKALENKES